MATPTCSSSVQNDEPLLHLDISTGKSIEVKEEPRESVNEEPATTEIKSKQLSELIRLMIEERQTKLNEQIQEFAGKIMHVLLNQIIPCMIAVPSHFKDLSFDFDDKYRVIYRIPSSEEAEISSNFTDESKMLSHKVDTSKEVYATLRSNLNAVRGMQCHRAVVENKQANPNLPESFDALVIDVQKEGLVEYTKVDFDEEHANDVKDPASTMIYHANAIKNNLAGVINSHINVFQTAILTEDVPHSIWQHASNVKETEDSWEVEVKMSSDEDPKELRKFVVSIETADKSVIAKVDVTQQVHDRIFENVSSIVGVQAKRTVNDDIPYLNLLISKHQQ